MNNRNKYYSRTQIWTLADSKGHSGSYQKQLGKTNLISKF